MDTHEYLSRLAAAKKKLNKEEDPDEERERQREQRYERTQRSIETSG